MRNPALAKAYRKSKILTKYYIAREIIWRLIADCFPTAFFWPPNNFERKSPDSCFRSGNLNEKISDE